MRTRPGDRHMVRVALATILALVPVVARAQVVTFEATVAQLRDADPEVRRQALRALADARYPEAAEPIAALLTDPDDDLQIEAMAAEMHLFVVDSPESRRRVGFVFEQWGRAPAEAVFERGPLALGAETVPDAVFTGLLAAMRDANRRVALEAIYTLGVLGPAGRGRALWRQAAAADLASVLQHTDRAYRTAALATIGRVFAVGPGGRAEQTAGDAVVQVLNDRDRSLRILATDTLAALRYDRALQALMERFASGGRGAEADAALRALAAIGHPSAAPIFIDQLASGRAERRRMAVEGLARTGPGDMLGDIQSRLQRESDRAVTLAVAFATARLAGGPVDPILSALLQPRFEAQAFGYLVELVGPRRQLLVAYARDPEPRIRRHLADASALSGDLAAIPVLEVLLEDPQPAVSEAAARAVSWLERRR